MWRPFGSRRLRAANTHPHTAMDYRILQDEVLVQGRRTGGESVQSAVRDSEISRDQDGGKPVSLSEVLKAAVYDALKACVRGFGMPLKLHGGSDGEMCGQYPWIRGSICAGSGTRS